MVKKAVTLYLDTDTVDELKSRKYNISLLCNNTLKVYTSEDFDDIAIAARLAAMDERISDLELDMKRRYVEFERAKSVYDNEVKLQESFKEECLEAKRTLILSRMIRELNSNIIAVEFDVGSVQLSCAELIKRIEELSPFFNLETHVTKLKNVLS